MVKRPRPKTRRTTRMQKDTDKTLDLYEWNLDTETIDAIIVPIIAPIQAAVEKAVSALSYNAAIQRCLNGMVAEVVALIFSDSETGLNWSRPLGWRSPKLGPLVMEFRAATSEDGTDFDCDVEAVIRETLADVEDCTDEPDFDLSPTREARAALAALVVECDRVIARFDVEA